MAYPTLITSRAVSDVYANRGNLKIAFILSLYSLNENLSAI
ncbi:hypothetical protein T11_3 [Trichinella zimbabwensis]|uniref:Uncharacterized protein n=1 Tax=Trichinella zimbabwensis TaxID=268475 RepID=A0A0V1GJJ0_9BILA|nr:hypothetical protein T11_16631 [Trichinella zimbabwensis]KRZ01404.1 hypothetical protein T11_3 [Trichinella zimbabwensis]